MCTPVYSTLMKAGKGSNPNTGTCLIWNEKCGQCNRPIPVGEVYRVMKFKDDRTSVAGIAGCAKVDKIACLHCAPTNDDEKAHEVVATFVPRDQVAATLGQENA